MKTQVLPEDFNPLAVIIPEPVAKPQVPMEHVAPASMVPNASQEQPVETTLADTNPAYFNVSHEVPTGLAFYHYSSISVRPYGLAERFKLGAATKGGRVRYVIDAVGATVDRPVMTMALMDFWFLCYWLRTMSYRGNPLAATWGCENTEHVRQVILEQVGQDTLVNKTMIERTDIQVIPVDDRLRELSAQLLDGELQLYVHPPTVSDFLERVEFGADWDDEFAYIADIAVYLRGSVHGTKIADRVKYLRSIMNHPEADAKMGILREAMTLLEQAGVRENFDSKCGHCGQQQKVSLEVDLLTFFPF